MREDAAPTTTRPSLSRRLLAWMAGFEDGQILRAAFFGMLAATIAVLVIDYLELGARDAAASAATAARPDLPLLPAFDPSTPGGKPGPPLGTDPQILEQPLSISLVGAGVLELVGTLDTHAADRFAAEVAVHGEYVKTVSLNSPGGSLEDAMRMGKLIRDKGFATSVAAGALCASSCPLVMAGGKKREASAKAAIGVHQFYLTETERGALGRSALADGKVLGAAMQQTQQTTAEISRYLTGMGVDASLWLHALDTPPSQIYYFSPEELANLRLVTNMND